MTSKISSMVFTASTSRAGLEMKNTAFFMWWVKLDSSPFRSFRKGNTLPCTCCNMSSAGMRLNSHQRNVCLSMTYRFSSDSFFAHSSALSFSSHRARYSGGIQLPSNFEVYLSPVNLESDWRLRSCSSSRFINSK
ncbi:hypothetical protein D3C75_812500 [compost metagenome]